MSVRTRNGRKLSILRFFGSGISRTYREEPGSRAERPEVRLAESEVAVPLAEVGRRGRSRGVEDPGSSGHRIFFASSPFRGRRRVVRERPGDLTVSRTVKL